MRSITSGLGLAISIRLALALLMALSISSTVRGAQDNMVGGIEAEFRHGQVFITWDQPDGEHGHTFNVYTGALPISSANLSDARLLAQRIESHSARDWWNDPATYFKEGEVEPTGFVIAEGGEPLDPGKGLFVHTVSAVEPGEAYYAVTVSLDGTEKRSVKKGESSLAEPVVQRQMPLTPIWQGKPGDKPSVAGARGLPLVLHLHGRGGVEKVNWLVFGSWEMGWREGLPFKFHSQMRQDHLVISPTDRTWVGRTLSESWDKRDHFSPVIDSFWYGYNDRIYDRQLMSGGTPTNYTERKNLWLIYWAREYFATDPDRTVWEGGSMGGCGGLSFGLRHPEIFSAIISHVPLVGYFGKGWGGSERRLTPFCGSMETVTSDGLSVRERMDSRTVLARAAREGIDLPFLVITNGRNDGSIPWRPNYRYYDALGKSRQGFVAAWDNLEHHNCMENTHPWMKSWLEPQKLFAFSLKESFPAFSNFSVDDNAGDGDKADGDLVGYINFGLEWDGLQDEQDSYEITVRLGAGDASLPVTVDITPRRLQNFKIAPFQQVLIVNRDSDGREVARGVARADSNGKVTCEDFKITDKQGNRLSISAKL
jgi:pimeloyl-ACP methyl ester carboxylesterase